MGPLFRASTNAHAQDAELPSVYVDTAIPSRLTGRPSRDLRLLRDQRITCLWWNGYRSRATAFVSDLVIAEARNGDPEAAQPVTRRATQFQNRTVTNARSVRGSTG